MSNTKVFIGGLSWNTDESTLSQTFEQVGEVTEVNIIKDQETGRPRGFGFVTFTSSEDANRAVERFDGKDLDGRNVKVNIAEDRRR